MSDEINQDEIEAMLQQKQEKLSNPTPDPPPPAASSDMGEAVLDQDEIEALLQQQKNQAAPAAPAPPLVASSMEASDASLGQSEIEQLMGRGKASGISTAAAAKPTKKTVQPSPGVNPVQNQDDDGILQGDVDLLFNQAQGALASIDNPTQAEEFLGISPFELHALHGEPINTEAATLDLLQDVELDVRIELGRSEMQLDEILKVRKGSVIPLDKLAGDSVDIYVNDRLVARGEVLVLNDNFCVRIGELIEGEEYSMFSNDD